MDSVYVALKTLQESSASSVQYLTAATALVAVVLGPIVAYCTTRMTIRTQTGIATGQISTQLKVAEQSIRAELVSSNRQAWINLFRDSVSECVAQMILIHSEKGIKETPSERMEKFVISRTKVSLLLNPLVDDHQKLESHLQTIIELMSSNEKDRIEQLSEHRQEVIATSQKIIKYEWERVKAVE